MSDESKREWENFTHNVTWLRKSNGLSKKKMANLLGLGVGSLNKIERGELPPRLDVSILFRLRDCFGISPKDLFALRLEHTQTFSI